MTIYKTSKMTSVQRISNIWHWWKKEQGIKATQMYVQWGRFCLINRVEAELGPRRANRRPFSEDERDCGETWIQRLLTGLPRSRTSHPFRKRARNDATKQQGVSRQDQGDPRLAPAYCHFPAQLTSSFSRRNGRVNRTNTTPSRAN